MNEQINPESKYTIKTAALELGLSQMYVRRAIQTGDLAAELEPIAPESKTNHRVIMGEALINWRDGIKTRSHREDGRVRFILYATPHEVEDIRASFEVEIVKPTYGKKEVELVADES